MLMLLLLMLLMVMLLLLRRWVGEDHGCLSGGLELLTATLTDDLGLA